MDHAVRSRRRTAPTTTWSPWRRPNGKVFVSVTRGNTVSVYTINPAAADGAAPARPAGWVTAIGSDGSVYYERADHHLAVLRPDGATAVGPVLADTPNGLGGGVQYLDVVAGGAVWVSEPAGQGLDAELHHLRRRHAARAGVLTAAR